MPCQGALSQAALAAACRNTNWEVRQRSGFNELPCCNSNSLVLFTDPLLMRCLSEGKLGWGKRERTASLSQCGKRRAPTSTEAFVAAGPQPTAGAVHSICKMQMKRVQLCCLSQTRHRSPRQWQRAPSPCAPTGTEPLKDSASTLVRSHTPCPLYSSSHPSSFPSPAWLF